MLLLKLALRPWRLAPYSQIFSATAVGFLLLLAGILFWFQQGLTPVLTRLHQEQVITAYLSPSVDPQDESRIMDEIHTALGAHAENSDVRIIQSDQFIQQIKKSYPDLGHELEDLGPEAAAVVPRYVSIKGFLVNTALDQIRGLSGIESAESSHDRNLSIIGAFSAMSWVAKFLSLGLCLALFSGLIHLARTNAYIHRDALSLLRLLGSDALSLQFPGVVSGFSVGALGGLLALGGWLSAGLWLSIQVRHLSPLLLEMPPANPVNGVILLLIGSSIGLMAGIFCGLTQAEAGRARLQAGSRS